MSPGQKPYRLAYMEDPFGNILGIYSQRYELESSAAAYGRLDGSEASNPQSVKQL